MMKVFTREERIQALNAGQGRRHGKFFDEGLQGATAAIGIGTPGPAVDANQVGATGIVQTFHGSVGVHRLDQGRIVEHAHDYALQSLKIHEASSTE
jgi:hypothetical protein